VAYKYDDKYGWATIFGRVLLGWLEDNLADRMPDLIVANPTWVEPGSRFATGHTERVLDAAAQEDVIARWNFDVANPRVVTKTRATAKSARNTAPAKRRAARELRAALAITDREQILGRRILVYDDVCTTGAQLNAVASCLLDDGGAAEVSAVVLARTPWRQRA
jgi:predicted amidophosphoribosyltransferase